MIFVVAFFMTIIYEKNNFLKVLQNLRSTVLFR